MKLVISDEILKEKMKEAINLLCGTVKKTLGPIGSNVIINNSSFSSFITNDGVTIAENIESDDVIINTILDIAKESALKTNENAGDGTTTTLVLLESIFNNGIKLINEGIKPIVIKRELDNKLEEIISMIKLKARTPSEKELLNIAIVSANDKKIGREICEAYLKTKNKNSIYIKEHNLSNTIINNINGYILESNLASPYFFADQKEIILDVPYILLINGNLEHIEAIANIINKILMRKKGLVIIADDFSELLINEIISINAENHVNIFLIKNPEYGVRKISILKDIKSISNALIIENLEYVSFECLGSLKSVKISLNNILMNYEKSDKTMLRKNEIVKDISLSDDEFEKEFHNRRLAMFDNGIVEILVGDLTTTARREKKMRYEDALCSISGAYSGVVPGSGIILYEISNKLNKEDIGSRILTVALKTPFEQIMKNGGILHDEIIKNIKDNNYELIYNLNTAEYESVCGTKILDSANVIINSLTSSVSIASMLLTTTSLVVNEHNFSIDKNHEL